MTVNTKRPAPVSTTTLPALLHAIGDARTDAQAITSVVTADAGLASRVLAMANSAQFGLSRTVRDVHQAVVLVGGAMIQTLAIASASSLLDGEGRMAETRSHALDVACLARRLAPLAGARPSDAFAAGLLHDLGELLLLQMQPTAYGELLDRGLGHADQLRAEKAAFGTDHALLAAEHLLDWRVPDVIADAVADHHDPVAWSDAVTLVVASADEIVHGDVRRDHATGLIGLDIPSAILDGAADDRAELESLFHA